MMESANKLVFVPHSTFTNVMNHQQSILEPTKNQINLIASEAKNILNERKTNPEKNYNEYLQYMRRQKNLIDETKKPIKIEVTEKIKNEQYNNSLPLADELLINDLPKNAKTRGKVLLHHIKNQPEINFNPKGELVVRDKTINGSNIVDLIHYITRERNKSRNAPDGFRELFQSLKETNVPNEAIGSTNILNESMYTTPISTSTPKVKSKQHSNIKDERELYGESDGDNTSFFSSRKKLKRNYTSKRGRKIEAPFQYGKGVFKWTKY